MNETIRMILSRRSERGYTDQPVSGEEKEMIIRCAMRAPTAGNMMLYSILEVEPEQKERLVETCDNQPFIAKAPLVLIFLADLQRWYDYYELSDVSGLCEKNGTAFTPPAEADLMLASCDALIAAQTAALAAESLEIGSCYIGDIMENYEIHREMFNLPPWVFPVTMLCFGHSLRKKRAESTVPRFPRESIHFKGRYKRLDDTDFDAMFAERAKRQFSDGGYIENAGNIGQHFYLKKTGSDFFTEMRRSVNVAMQAWRGE